MGASPKLLDKLPASITYLGTTLTMPFILFLVIRSLMGMLTVPGLWLQRITTKQPDDTQAAVAIHALEGAMALEAKQGGELVIA